MIVGLMERSKRGKICIVMRVFSRVYEGGILLICGVWFPRWVVISM